MASLYCSTIVDWTQRTRIDSRYVTQSVTIACQRQSSGYFTDSHLERALEARGLALIGKEVFNTTHRRCLGGPNQ